MIWNITIRPIAFGLFFFSATLCDTIHFTNSKVHLLNATNFTRYDLKVPESSLNVSLAEGTDEDVSEESTDRIYVNRHKLLTSEDFNKSQRNNINSRLLEIIPTSTASSTSGTDHKIKTKESVSHGIFLPPTTTQSKKTVYSPDLLKKFLQDYSEKMRSSEEDDDMSEINRRSDDEPHTEDDYIEPKLGQTASIEEKLNEIAKLSHQITTERSSFEDEDEHDDFNKEEKFGGGQHQHDWRNKKYSNRFNDRDGWVSLDAIPWSSSKVSKWHPNANTQYGHVSPVSVSSSHWDDNDSYESHRPPRPPSYNSFPTHDDDYMDNRPSPHYSGGHNKKHTYVYSTDNGNFPKPSWANNNYDEPERPSYQYASRPKPSTDYYANKPSSWYDNHHSSSNYDSQSQKPLYWTDGDILTDGKPSNFPSKQQMNQRPQPHYFEQQDRYPQSHYKEPDRHPATHPSNGNGEWVLISTTKGYHMPPKYGKRAMTYRPGADTSIPQKTQTIQLNVLTAASSDNSSSNVTTSHNGLIEVEPSRQSMEEVAEEILENPKKKKPKRRKILKGVPLSSRDSHQDSSAILAAVGAGMVPATVAMLMPMVLGRKRRSTGSHSYNVTNHPNHDYESVIPRGITM